jgi:hypothetical protein
MPQRQWDPEVDRMEKEAVALHLEVAALHLKNRASCIQEGEAMADLGEPEVNHQDCTEISLIQMRDNSPTDMEDPYPAIGKRTISTNECKHYPL